MAVKSTNTQAEALQSVIQDLASMKTMPDADIGFILHIETQVVQYLRSGMDAQQQASNMGGMGMGNQAPPPMDPMMGGGPPEMGGMPGGMGAGAMDPGSINLPASPLASRQGPMMASMPPVDEINRMQTR